MSIEINFRIPTKVISEGNNRCLNPIVSPGEIITDASGYMRGHGTYMGMSNTLFSSALGEVDTVNKLVQVKNKSSKYSGNVGDLIIGRITEVGIKRWKVETNTRRESYLLLSAINLPGGELRRRSFEDEIHMRDLLQEGDLITAEVQIVHKDGSLSLQTRNLNYGKLIDDGLFLIVSSYLIKRSRNHFIKFVQLGINLCLGNNGYIWISMTLLPNSSSNPDDQHSYPQLNNDKQKDSNKDNPQKQDIDLESYERMVRIRNVIIAMAKHNIMIYEDSILICYETSLYYEPKELLKPEISLKFISAAKRKKCGE